MEQGELRESTRVLVVDDDPFVLKTWGRMLPHPRYSTTLLTDPRQALEFLASTDVDVAVVDLRMPVIDGLTLLKTIKRRWPEVEVVMVSAYGGVSDAVEAIKNAAYDFLSKPLDRTRPPSLLSSGQQSAGSSCAGCRPWRGSAPTASS